VENRHEREIVGDWELQRKGTHHGGSQTLAGVKPRELIGELSKDKRIKKKVLFGGEDSKFIRGKRGAFPRTDESNVGG